MATVALLAGRGDLAIRLVVDHGPAAVFLEREVDNPLYEGAVGESKCNRCLTAARAARGAKCPLFKSRDSVLQRPNDETASATTVSPGLHEFPSDGYSVVWWDPTPGGGLVLDEKPAFGVRREDLIVKDVPKHVVADGRSRYDRWQLARHDARAQGAARARPPSREHRGSR